jgi:ribosomal protein S27E
MLRPCGLSPSRVRGESYYGATQQRRRAERAACGGRRLLAFSVNPTTAEIAAPLLAGALKKGPERVDRQRSNSTKNNPTAESGGPLLRRRASRQRWANVRCRGCGNATVIELRPGESSRLRCSRCGRPDVKWIAGLRRQRKAKGFRWMGEPRAIGSKLSTSTPALAINPPLDDDISDLFRGGPTK